MAGAAVVDDGVAGLLEALCTVVEPVDDEHPASITAASATSPAVIRERFTNHIDDLPKETPQARDLTAHKARNHLERVDVIEKTRTSLLDHDVEEGRYGEHRRLPAERCET